MNWENRAYQQEAVAACLADFLHHGKSSVMLESPVGSGKTYMALETIHLLQGMLGRKLRVNWVAPRRHLLRQVMEANRDLHQDVIVPVSLFEKLPPAADFVVLDEAHHEATQTCVLLYEKMKSDYVLGLSATPMRTDRMKLSFQDTVTTCSIDRLIREGYLSPVHSYLLPHYGPQIVAECYLDKPETWGKSLVFFPTVMECHEFQRRLADAGVPCEVVTAESDKDRQLEAFVAGKVRVVANVLMLTEGFDQPDVQTIFARDASRLPTIQMCGRGLRLAPGKTHCLFERVTPARRRFRLTNGEWMALQDGTAAIEEMLKLSLALLEKREQIDTDRRDGRRRNLGARPRRARPVRPPSATGFQDGEQRDADRPAGHPVAARATRSSAARFAAAGPSARSTAAQANDVLDRLFGGVALPPFYNKFSGLYRSLYHVYSICNGLCWSGRLPPAALCLDRSQRASGVGGCATSNNVVIRGSAYHQISLVLRNCLLGGEEGFLRILLHEMTHIWQFASRTHGGHGADFRNEMLRIGIKEMGDMAAVRNGSLADQAFAVVHLEAPSLISDLREAYDSELEQSTRGDHAFFRLMVESRAL